MEERTLRSCVKEFRRKELNMTQKEFARETGVGNATLVAIEKGYEPTYKVYERLSKAMGLDVKELRELKCFRGKGRK